MRKIENAKEKRFLNQGITLIALVITIIVLLILVAVSISTLIGENGILTKATIAKNKTIEEEEKEQIKLAYGATLANKQQNEDKTVLSQEIENELKKLSSDVTVSGDSKKITVTFNKTGNIYNINTEGQITGPTNLGENPEETKYNSGKTVQEAKKQNLPYKSKTTIKDEYENQIVIPEGFKIASDSANNVTGGVVIEEATQGRQFVWIPVGTVKSDKGNGTINLDRYEFTYEQGVTPRGEDAINTYYQELETSSYGNTVAKNITTFKTSATNNGGYYIGRDLEETTMSQTQAADLSRGKYAENKSFTSDLMNSYAFDTVLIFIQKYGQSDYAIKTNTTQPDVQCNIYNMATLQWTTESSTRGYTNVGIVRGVGRLDEYSHVSQPGGRGEGTITERYAFRTILYF